ncbi:hypothetical protein VSR34_37715 [Paraburkholderia sp. JHI2823]|uniref:hypothetical protein n=1 Tax=Paraburkholderia sp. JHI2823 TaxID=3112960 RepID=UPI003171667D
MCHTSARNPDFYRLLLRIDQDFAEQTRSQHCHRCNGVLHSARYRRKPRGLTREARAECGEFRYSFCCAECRRRTTPFSVRFLGRRVYVAAIMVVVSATRASAGTAAAMRQLDALGVPRATIARWQHWWQTDFVSTPFWTLGRAAFVPPIETAHAPASLLERFAATSQPEPLLCLLRWLSPLTGGRAMSTVREGR